jgi:hypothetical protein
MLGFNSYFKCGIITDKDPNVNVQNIPLKLIKMTMYMSNITSHEKCLSSLLSISESRSWDPFTEGQINALDRVQMKAAQFTYNAMDSDWENLAQRRTIVRLRTSFKAFSGERAWKAIRDRLRKS